MVEKVTAIVQARVGSTRLRSKIFEKIGDLPAISLLLKRLELSKKIDEIIIATTDEDEDDQIVNYCKKNGYKFFRGHRDNVLERFYDCANEFKVETIARITADDPFKDYEVIDKAIDIYNTGDFDYVSNTIIPTYPEGIDIEIFSFNALEIAKIQAIKNSDMMHVTPYIIKNPKIFKCYNFKHSTDLSRYRFTLDYLEDLKYLNEIFCRIQKINFSFLEVVKVIKAYKIKEFKHIERNEGYIKDIKNENWKDI